MQDIETVTAFLAALNANDFHTVETYLGDTFVLHGNLSKQPGKYVFLGLFMGLAYGFPDYAFNLQHVCVAGGTVEAIVQFTGTHTGNLILSLVIPGLPAIPPTDKKLSRPAYCLAFTLRHEKIVTIDLDHGQDSIFLWILKQLNIALSSAS